MIPNEFVDLKSLPIIIGIITAGSTTCGKAYKNQQLPELKIDVVKGMT